MKMRSSETAPQFFYRLNAAAVKAEIPFQTRSKRLELHLRRFVKKLKDVQLKTALEGHQFQSLKPRRPGHAFLTQNVDSGTPPVVEKHVEFQTPEVEELPRVADPETPEYGPDHCVPSMPEKWSEQQRMENRNTFCEKCKKWDHPEDNCWQDVVCGNCSETGHGPSLSKSVGIALKRDIRPESVERNDEQTVEKSTLEFQWRAFKTEKHMASQGMLNDTGPSQTLNRRRTQEKLNH
ncbi:LOW QUALITY PROTEIN: hypothetical protein PHMEG_00032311 [Phytophthora megakarya]|uniref:Uncharacterized protein n=1 Tax=Phytophthora megakarya TaxID=4795 RepID=A0A225UV01_9STRA|nr:LOW QUALITY PROTEIN: hypothetical protein PHMEG_00032311 [Phytophthora megakarya]